MDERVAGLNVSKELAQITAFRPVLFNVALALLCYHLGAMNSQSAGRWIVEFGALGFILSEIGAWLASDYYCVRRHRGEPSHELRLSKNIDPSQLVLKGAWASYLIAFLVALIVSISLDERGWVVMLIAFGVFLTRYYEGAPPIFWRRIRAGAFISASGTTWMPYMASLFITRGHVHPVAVVTVGLAFGAAVFHSLYDSVFR